MKKIRIIATLVLMQVTSVMFAQDDMDNLIKGGLSDANYLIKGYTSPFMIAFANGLNQGWYNTAKTHKWPGFDLTFSASLVSVPSSDKTFFVDNNKLQEVTLEVPSDGKVPTIFGDDSPSTYYLKSDANQSNPITGPLGADLPISLVPVPIAQLGIGLPKGIDLKIRFVPTINIKGTGSLDLFGIGVMHDVKQYIPGVKALPFDLAGFVGFTKFKTTIDLDEVDLNKVSNFNISATTIQALISKKLAILTVYAGFGYNINKGSLKINGDFDFDNDGQTDVTDPVDFSINTSGPRATGGIRLKFGPITLHGDYTAQKYNTITAGFGVSVR